MKQIKLNVLKYCSFKTTARREWRRNTVSEETENFLFSCNFITTKKRSLRDKTATVVKTADFGNRSVDFKS